MRLRPIVDCTVFMIMAPVNIDTVDGQFSRPSHRYDPKQDYFADGMSPERLRDTIQDFFEIQEALHRYLGPETQEKLKYQMYSFTISLLRPCTTDAKV